MSTTQRLITEIEDALKALKATYAISGSLVEFNVIKSASRTVMDTESSTKLRIKITFIPSRKLEQNKLIEMVGVISPQYSLEGSTLELPKYNVNGRMDDDGNVSCETELEHSASSPGKFTLTAYAIVSGPATGTFTYETTVE